MFCSAKMTRDKSAVKVLFGYCPYCAFVMIYICAFNKNPLMLVVEVTSVLLFDRKYRWLCELVQKPTGLYKGW